MKIVSHFLVATVLVIFTYFSHGQKVSNAMCTSTYYQVPVQTNITNFAVNVLLPTKNQSRITQIFVQAALDTSSLSAAVLGTKGLLETFRIYGTFCQPTTHHRNTSAHALQILVHGIGFDSSYWDFKGAGVPEEDYSYVYQAANLGISTFRFDRLGTGLSERPDDGINVVQAATEVAILTHFAQLAKSTKQIGGQKVSGITLLEKRISRKCTIYSMSNPFSFFLVGQDSGCRSLVWKCSSTSAESTKSQSRQWPHLDWIFHQLNRTTILSSWRQLYDCKAQKTFSI